MISPAWKDRFLRVSPVAAGLIAVWVLVSASCPYNSQRILLDASASEYTQISVRDLSSSSNSVAAVVFKNSRNEFPIGADPKSGLLQIDFGDKPAQFTIHEIGYKNNGLMKWVLPDLSVDAVFLNVGEIPIELSQGQRGEFFAKTSGRGCLAVCDQAMPDRAVRKVDWTWVALNFKWHFVLIAFILFVRPICRFVRYAILHYDTTISLATNPSSTHPRLHQLTSLRFFAAACIIVAHTFGYLGTSPLPANGLKNGVTFFFVLSGFILAYSYRNFRSFSDVSVFLRNRFARIFPLHWAVLAISTIFLFQNYELRGLFSRPSLLASNVALLQSWIPIQEYFFGYNAVSWSISTEFAFYLLFPLLARYAFCGVGLSFLLTIGFVFLANAGIFPANSETDVSIVGLLYVNPLARVFEFSCGVAVYRIFARQVDSRVRSAWMWTALEVLVLVLAVVLFYYIRSFSDKLLPVIGPGGRQYLSYSGFVIVAPALVYVFALGRGVLSKILQSRPFLFLGEISFSCYLVHQTVIFYFHLNPSILEPMSLPVRVAVVWIVIVLMSAALWKFVEVPFRRIIRNYK